MTLLKKDPGIFAFVWRASVVSPAWRMLGACAITCAVVSACAPPNPRLTAPPETYMTEDVSAPVSAKVDYNPKVDVLFVIDNSDSMKGHQDNLRSNIDRFAEAFEANERLDFHIGAVSVFDSKRFGPVIKDFYPLGQLRPLRDPAHPEEIVQGPSYVTRVPRYNEILGETLKIGTQARGTSANDLGGPEYEESFTPIMAAVDGRNAGFIRPDAHLAVIMITDANDDSPVSSSKLDRFLWTLKKGDRSKFSTYAVLALENCNQDPGGAPTKILEFMELSQGHVFNLCAPNYGDRLAEAGRLIQAKASRLRIDLNAVPEDQTLRVAFGGQELPRDPVKGWTYDPEKVAVIVSGEAGIKGSSDAKLEISFTPIDPRKMGTIRAKSVAHDD